MVGQEAQIYLLSHIISRMVIEKEIIYAFMLLHETFFCCLLLHEMINSPNMNMHLDMGFL